MIKKTLSLLSVIIFSIGVASVFHHLNDGFNWRRIQSLDVHLSEGWNEQTYRAIDQPFYYLGRGRQCFAFESQDGQYILKLPRTDHMIPSLWQRIFPFKKGIPKREMRMHFILNSFEIAFRELRDQTSILALHFGRSESKKTITLVDRIGIKHTFPFGAVTFLLQHKHPILMKAFSNARKEQNNREAEKILSSLLDVVAERASKSILNLDRLFLDNYGYDGERAYQIDVGSFFRKKELEPRTAFEKSVRDTTDPIREWLTQNDPEMLPYFDQKLKTIL